MGHGKQFNYEGVATNNHTITTDVIDGFERKSFELLEYINSLEAKLEKQRCEFKEKERQLEEQKIRVEQKLEIDLQHAQLENARLQRNHQNFVEETERTIESLRKDVDATDSSLRREKRKVQDLESTVTDLKHQLLQRRQLYNYHKATHEKEMTRLEEHVNVLRKRVSLGWILGRLTEAYLRMDPLQQGGGRSEGLESAAGKDINIDRIEKQVRCLIDSAVQSPMSNDVATSAQPGIIRSDDEGSEKDDGFEKSIRNSGSIRRGESRSPPSRNAQKQRSTAAEMEESPSIAQQSCDPEHNYVQTDIEVLTESETHTRRRCSGQNKIDKVQAVNVNATVGLTKSTNSQNDSPSKSPPPVVRKPTTSSVSSPRSSNKDLTCIDGNSSNPSRKDISRRQSDIQKLKFISNVKSKARLTSTDFRGV